MLVAKRDELRLDPDLLKVLASDRRRDILHHLKKRRMTVTELSRAMTLGKPTVLDHLKRLQDVGLVLRHEDERLWVYYSLTDDGRRVIRPKVSVFLMLTATILAMAGLAALFFLLPAEPGPDVAVVDGTLYPAGGTLLLDVDAQGDIDGWTAGLTRDPAPKGDPELVAVALQRVDAGVQANVGALAPGTYYLYLSDPSGDNREAMPKVVVPVLEASLPTSWWHGLDPAPSVTATADGVPLAGELRIGAVTTEIPDTGASVDVAALDDLGPGHHAVTFTPVGTDRPVPIGTFRSIAPDVDVAPRTLIGRDAEFLVSVQGDGPAPQALDLGQATVTEEAPGLFRVRTALELGHQAVQIGRLHQLKVEVLPDLHLRLEREVDRLSGVLFGSAGVVSGAEVFLDGGLLATTDGTGSFEAPWPEPGAPRLTIRAPDAPDVGADLRVTATHIRVITPAPLDLDLVPRSGGVDVAIENPGGPQNVSLVATVAGQIVAAQHVALEGPEATVRLPGLDVTTIDVQAYRVPGVRVTFDAQPLATATQTSTQTSAASGSPALRVPAFLGDPASDIERVHLHLDAGDAEGEAASTPWPLAVVVLALWWAARRRR